VLPFHGKPLIQMLFHENMIFCNLLKLQSVKLKRQHALVFFLMVSVPPFGYAVQPEKIGTAWVYSSESDYESAKTFLIDAIKERGLVI